MARYRRIVADDFIDGPKVWTESRPVRQATVDASGDRPRVGGIYPGTALIAGPDMLPSQERWIPASAAAQGLYAGPSRTFAVAGANQAGAIYIVDLNTLNGGDTYTPWVAGDTVTGLPLSQDRAFNVLVPTGVNITKGAPLTTNAQGLFVLATTGQRGILTADETFNNNTGLFQHVRAIPVFGA